MKTIENGNENNFDDNFNIIQNGMVGCMYLGCISIIGLQISECNCRRCRDTYFISNFSFDFQLLV